MRVVRAGVVALYGVVAFGWFGPVDAWQQASAATCRVSGRAIGGTVPLPGVSVLVKSGDAVRAATSTDPDGTYHLGLPAGTYELTAELTGFTSVARSVTVGAAPCDQTIDFPLALAPRVPLTGTPAARGAAAAPAQSTGAQPPFGGRGQAPTGVAASRFETLAVQTQAAAAAGVEPAEAADTTTRLLLPPGFSTEGPTEALAINGNMASIDRGMINNRLEAIGRGEFNPSTGEFGQGFGPGGQGFAGGRTARVSADAAAPAGWAAVAGPAALVAGGGTSCWVDAAAARAPTTYSRIIHSAAPHSTAHRTSCVRIGGAAAALLTTDLRDDARRSAPHSGGVQRRSPHQLHRELHRQSRRRSLRPIRHRSDSGDARGRLLVGASPTHRSRHRAAVCREPDSGRADEPRLGRTAAIHSSSQPRRHQPQLPLRDHQRVTRRQLEPSRHP